MMGSTTDVYIMPAGAGLGSISPITAMPGEGSLYPDGDGHKLLERLRSPLERSCPANYLREQDPVDRFDFSH